LSKIIDLGAARGAFGEVLLDSGAGVAVGGGYRLVVIQVDGKLRAQSGDLREGAGLANEAVAALGADGKVTIGGEQIRGFQGATLEARELLLG
jgi:hypothetical protein